MTSQTSEKPRILVVEDDPDQRMLICEVLAMHFDDSDEQRITAVRSAAECLRADLESFDVVLQDYNLPDGGGLNLLSEIRRRADIPVIVVTAENTRGTVLSAIRAGAADYVIKLGDYLFTLPIVVTKNVRQHRLRRENAELQRRLSETLDELAEKNRRLSESMELLRAAADTDALTGLSNRRRFGEVLDRQFSEAVRYGFDLTCCMCDLDRYKQLNDELGHQAGDEALAETADVIRSRLRTSDVAARYGGDEFVLLLPHTSIRRGVEVAGRIRSTLAERWRSASEHHRRVTISVGVASLGANRPANSEVLVRMADRSLYVAKTQGRDRVVACGQAPPEPGRASA